MPRIQIPGRPMELDTNLAIEDGISEVLKDSNIARVSVSSIEKEYELYGDEGELLPSTLEEKCQYLSAMFSSTFEIKDNDVWFRLPSDLRKRAK